MKSTAPSFIARTATGTSPWPVITITGQSTLRSASAAMTSKPSICGIRRSSRMQPGSRSGSASRKSSAAAEGMGADLGGAEHEAQRAANVAIVVDHVDASAVSADSSFEFIGAIGFAPTMGCCARKAQQNLIQIEGNGTDARRSGCTSPEEGRPWNRSRRISEPSDVSRRAGQGHRRGSRRSRGHADAGRGRGNRRARMIRPPPSEAARLQDTPNFERSSERVAPPGGAGPSGIARAPCRAASAGIWCRGGSGRR